MKTRTKRLLAAALALAAASLAGCYTKVIDADGIGSDRYPISDPDNEHPDGPFGFTKDF